MMEDPPTNGSLFSFGDRGSKVKRGGVVYGVTLRGRNFWAKLDTVMVSGGSLDWNIIDKINLQALQSWNHHQLTPHLTILKNSVYLHMMETCDF
jgi:hypothetical protein